MKKLLTMTALLTLFLTPAGPSLAVEEFDLKSNDPIVIRRPGNYTLRRNLIAQSELPLITIAVDDVSLDLNGFSLKGLGNKIGEGIVVDGRTNVAVQNGFLSRFGTAVRVSGSSNVEVANLQITGQDIAGGPPETGILILNSRAAHVHENVVNRTFLGIFVRGGRSGANTIKGNTISGGDNGQLGICYNPAPGADSATDGPSGDLIAENHISRFRTGIQTSVASQGNIFVRNYVNFIELGFDERTPGSNTIANNQTIELP